MFAMSLTLRLKKFTWLKLLGVLFGAAGIFVFGELWDLSLSRKNVIFGHVFLFISVVFCQLFTIIQKFIKGYNPLMMTTVAYWMATCTTAIPAIIVTATNEGSTFWPTSSFEWVTVPFTPA